MGPVLNQMTIPNTELLVQMLNLEYLLYHIYRITTSATNKFFDYKDVPETQQVNLVATRLCRYLQIGGTKFKKCDFSKDIRGNNIQAF